MIASDLQAAQPSRVTHPVLWNLSRQCQAPAYFHAVEIWQNDWHNNQTTQNVLDCDEAHRSSGSFSVSLAWLTSSGEDPERKLRAANGMNAYLNTRMG